MAPTAPLGYANILDSFNTFSYGALVELSLFTEVRLFNLYILAECLDSAT